MDYYDVIWIMVVTVTNLGFGDFTPSYWGSRTIIAIVSVFGVFQTACIVGVLSEALVIPIEEKRMLGMMEKQRIYKIRRHAAATLIQQAWRRYCLHRQMKLRCFILCLFVCLFVLILKTSIYS